ncbi:transcriptional family [Leptolyngbya sp. Heron Island J]|uniref:helix-turn-helix transcriptional regulator n=1 Tax=Leptolyngbya sp. Heron Island J TaxID=1385935 RepID=UPI0003B9707B|nr:AraC family transcriptional regulator [Leptolyngbya sp. Heron Island J]ESA33724.1 transcriptional family [Leptolyngbya sp. Heron Island J]
MAVTLSQQEYWDLVKQPQHEVSEEADTFETAFQYPAELGQGYSRSIELRDGLDLGIDHYQLRERVTTHAPERPHPIEYVFRIAGKGNQFDALSAGQYALYGSGMAPAETSEHTPDETVLEINVHIEPSVLRTYLGESFDLTSAGLDYLFQPTEQLYFERLGVTTVAMHTALHQLLHCPFTGITKKAYLESKVWELMALLLDQELQRRDVQPSPSQLKSDDIDRIHHARKILLQQLDNPPSLLSLARQVGLNDCTLKRGFRQVFGETTFGYLHNHRMEKARQLLIEGEVNVSEAARRVGFTNRSYFAAAFRKKYGVSPRKYRRWS